MENIDIAALNEEVKEKSAFLDLVRMEMGKVIIGQKHLIDSLLIALLADGHILLEGVPGLAKTLSIRTLAKIVDVKFARIQFTPDLLPADLIGTLMYSQKEEKFLVKQGPIFANFILADEINRAPAKVQSALLEAMQERQVTIGDNTYDLPKPFLVMATQNPLEQEGTYPLPEAQVDRFMLKVLIDYPKRDEERQIIRLNLEENFPEPQRVITGDKIEEVRQVVRKIHLSDKIENYILDIVFATRRPGEFGMDDIRAYIRYGASPRASINLALAAKAKAFIEHRGFVLPEDIKSVVHDVMRHRIGLTYEAEAENVTSEDIINRIINKIEVP